MRTSFVVLAMLLSVPPAQAQNAKPNTLTAQEIADGWILLFDGETTFGWQGGVTVQDGVLRVASSKWASPHLEITEMDVEYEYRPMGKGVASVAEPAGPHWMKTQLAVVPGKEWHSSRASSPKDVPGGGLPSRFLRWDCDDKVTLELRNVKAKPHRATSLFDGKSLTGWKVFPGKKSKFTVEDGAIRIQDGPGDLQTVGKYQNFVFQLEVKSNGKHLNSGVFFRCRDNEYQNGYEAQIRNQFTAEPTQDYTVDEYDAGSNKLVGKKKIKSSAVDFGTGAIYRRIPARKEVAKDGEWFTMTVAAHGPHLATWVNGIQQVDWVDNRPKSDNARTGFKLDAGHISFQGHDPTTDLSFRKIRIATASK